MPNRDFGVSILASRGRRHFASERVRNQLLPGAALSRDEHGRVCGRDLTCCFDGGTEWCRRAQQQNAVAIRARAIGVLLRPRLACHDHGVRRASDHDLQLRPGERLREIIRRAGP